MLLRVAIAHGVADGSVELAYRRWSKARVRAGSTFISPSGVIRVEAVDQVDPDGITDGDARLAGAESPADVRAGLGGSSGQPVFRIRLAWVGPDPRHSLSAQTTLTPEELAPLQARLDRLDRRTSGAWTRAVLELVREQPGRRAADLSATLGHDKESFKLDVRKLKNLGLTHSLETGYEISPRGRAYLEATEDS